MKTVSSIIPAFNSARTVEHTVKSALAQSYSAHEIIIVDDGSTDRTGSIVDALAAANSTIKVVHQSNRGLAAARNRGILEATGDYIATLDADDIWHPDKLTLQVAALEANPRAALAYAWFRRIDEDDRVLPGSASPRVEGSAFHRHLDYNFISNGSSPLMVAAVARTIGYDERIVAGEDYLFQLQLARHHPIACVPAYLTGYRLRLGSMSHDTERMLRGHLALFRMLERGADRAARRIIAARIARFEVELVRNRVRRGAAAEALDALARSLRAAPHITAVALADEARRGVERSLRPVQLRPGARFESYALDELDGAWASGRSARRDAALSALDLAAVRG